MADTEKHRISESMDDLMMKTIGMMDSIPNRIETLERYVRELEQKFCRHEGEQEQGIKRIGDRIENLEKLTSSLHTESLKQIQAINKEIEALRNIVGITPDQVTLINQIKQTCDLLEKDYSDRQEVKKTIWHYIVSVVDHFLRYAMLPLTITILVVLGLSPDVIPGYNPNKISQDSKYIFNEACVELFSMMHNNQITEEQLRVWMRRHPDAIFIINNQPASSIKIPDPHFYIYIPNNQSEGFIQLYNNKGKEILGRISVVRKN